MKSFAVTPLTWAALATLTDVPVVVKFATSPVTLVPLGSVTEMVLADSLTVPAVPRMAKLVIAFALEAAAVTVTVYCTVEASSAVTVYTTGLVKSFVVTPLTCTTLPTITDVPVDEKVGESALTSVPPGTVSVMVLADSLIAPDAERLGMAKEVMDFDEFAVGGVVGGESDPPPHALIKSVAIKTKNICMLFIVISRLLRY